MEASKFWRARDVWTEAIMAKQVTAARSKGRFRRPTLNEQARKWSLNASKYLANRPSVLAYSQGVSVQPPDTTAKTLALLEALPLRLFQNLDARLSEVAFNAFREWPVSSGFSKSALFLSFLPEGTTFEAAIGDAAPYSLLIKGGPTRKLIGTPAKSAAEVAIQAALQAVSDG
jgi:hypothetical protein